MGRHRALTHVMLGGDPPAQPGQLIPEHYTEVYGEKKPVDFERLVKLGAAEAADEKKKTSGLSKLTREELDAKAAELGVDDPEDLPSKEAVIEAIEAAQG